jgi:predicted NUDIX family phosphoesterase
MNERVLVFHKEQLDKLNLSTEFSNKEDNLKKFTNDIINWTYFIDREFAEINEDYKQVIPYCIIRKGHNILTYQRTDSSGESRLHNKWSIGVGGHINPCDTETISINTIYTSIKRELREELEWGDINLDTITPRLIGLILDNSNSVGRVHFGVVYELRVISLNYPKLFEDSLSNIEWLSLGELKRKNNLESWSKLLVNNYK